MRSRDSMLFWFLCFAHLAMVWAFPFVPTEDGPAHVYNAVILKEYNRPDRVYSQYFEIRREWIPNWTSHLLLAGMMYVVDPYIAHKLLVSIWLLGLPLAYRYFLRSVGAKNVRLAPFCFLFLFCRAFLLGFYNYCLSIVLFFWLLGYCINRRENFAFGPMAIVAGALVLSYTTHLVGCLLSIAGLVCIALAVMNWRAAVCSLLAAVPAGLLCCKYTMGTGMLLSSSLSQYDRATVGALPARLFQGIGDLDKELFQAYAGSSGWLAALVLLWLEVLVVAALFRGSGARSLRSLRFTLAALTTLILVAFLFVPDHFGEHGGYSRCRFALLAPLLALACLLPLGDRRVEKLLWVALLGLIGLNLLAVGRCFRSINHDLRDFVSGMGASSKNRTLRLVKLGRGGSLIQPLGSAASYYCLSTGNIDLDNYEASTTHFPIRWREQLDAQIPPRQDRRPVILLHWRSHASPPAGYAELYGNGKVRVFFSEESSPSTP